jgi:hypothetical protein
LPGVISPHPLIKREGKWDRRRKGETRGRETEGEEERRRKGDGEGEGSRGKGARKWRYMKSCLCTLS